MNILYIGEYSINIKKLFNKIKKYNLTLFETKNNVNILTKEFLESNKHITTIYSITTINDIYNNLFFKEKKEYDIIYLQSFKYIDDILLLLSFSFTKNKSVIMIHNYVKKKDTIMKMIIILKKKYILSLNNDTLILKTNNKTLNYIPNILTFYHTSSNNQKINFHLLEKKEKPINLINIEFDSILSNRIIISEGDKNISSSYLLYTNSYFSYINNYIFRYINRKHFIFNAFSEASPFLNIIENLKIFNIIYNVMNNSDNVIILHQNFIEYESHKIYKVLDTFNNVLSKKIKIIDLTTQKTNKNIFNTFEFDENNYMKIFFNNGILNEDIFKIAHKLPKIDYISLARNYYSSNDTLCIKRFLLSIIFIIKIQKKGGGFILFFKNSFDKSTYDILTICKQMYEEVYIRNLYTSPTRIHLVCNKFNPNLQLEQQLEEIYYKINEKLYVHQLLDNKIDKKYLTQLSIYKKKLYNSFTFYQNEEIKFREKNKNDKIEIIFQQLIIFFNFIKTVFF